MKWSERYVTGIKRIDDQHKALFENPDVFRDALIEGWGNESMASSWSRFAVTPVSISASKRSVWNDVSVRRPTDTQAHSKFLHGFSEFEERYTMVGFQRADAQRLVEFVDDWLADHICCIDRQLKPYAQGYRFVTSADFCGTLH